jgi:hypothetical protein
VYLGGIPLLLFSLRAVLLFATGKNVNFGEAGITALLLCLYYILQITLVSATGAVLTAQVCCCCFFVCLFVCFFPQKRKQFTYFTSLLRVKGALKIIIK